MNPAGEKTGHIPRVPFCSEGSVLLYLQRKYWGNGTDSTRNLSSVNSVCSVGGLWPDEAQLSAGNLLLQYTLALGFSLYVYRLRGQTGQRPSPHLIFLKWIYFSLHVHACVHVWEYAQECWCPQRPERALDLLGLEVQVAVSCPCGCCDPNKGLLQEQWVLSTAKGSL